MYLFHLVLARAILTSSITMGGLAASHETNVLTLNFASSPNARQSTVTWPHVFRTIDWATDYGLRGIWGGPPCRGGGTLTHRTEKGKKNWRWSIGRLEERKREKKWLSCASRMVVSWRFNCIRGAVVAWLHHRQLWHLSIVDWLPSRDRALLRWLCSLYFILGFFLFKARLLSHCNGDIVMLQPVCTCLPWTGSRNLCESKLSLSASSQKYPNFRCRHVF
ncbi:hypothetical protein M441DRAFT_348395 [Trichoderma asperellum CBS 433.97]|uniref:Secreted protein n=1 Tax=Trichoderma asperellum (strain ATCC 204424 / CBS 433.97 / NBRC 101777) TaxID=1042311 RepID=A0A2T3ZI17_TRIA4|nr:hypothetical protein M441DRAFT_348395 [Trichoderma asperellum CBS 433.97]PTB44413.1 hypothetical protein M441DRAFT_348395 [Trichoderma asperellum CBS 433.97]